jgi:hypothetical protein
MENKSFYDPTKIYKHKNAGYKAIYIGNIYKRKPTYRVIETTKECGFLVNDQFTPNDPERWFDIEPNDFIGNHLRNIKILKAIYEGKRFFVECSLDDKDGAEIPNSNFAIKEIELPNFTALESYINQL